MLTGCQVCRAKLTLLRLLRGIWCMVADATAEYHTFRQHTAAKRTFRQLFFRTQGFCFVDGIRRTGLLTELLFFGPNAMAGDAFSVSDE